jgi:hypothetical protein
MTRKKLWTAPTLDMARDLISAKSRLKLREYFVGTSLSIIADTFAAAGIQCDVNYHPPVGGQRRYLVEQYYRTLDFSRWDDVQKLLAVFEHVLDRTELALDSADQYQREQAKKNHDLLLRYLGRDGYEWKNGRIVPPAGLISVSGLQTAVGSLAAPELQRQIARLRDSVSEDPALAIGTAKEMLETTCKTILDARGVIVDPGWDVPALLKETRKILKLLPEDIPAAAKGAETIKRLLNNLGQVGVGLSELRNLYGSGHGRSGASRGLSPRHARLAVGAVTTLVLFLFETHDERP